MITNNQDQRFGSASFATERDLRAAGMFEKKPNSILFGFFGKQPLYYSSMGGVLLVAGARGGKLRDILAYNICSGICASTMLILDMKGELAAISRDQTTDKKFCIYWNPQGLHGLPQHRINPLEYIRIDSPSLVSDLKVFCENAIPLPNSGDTSYFALRAREYLEAVSLTCLELNGTLTLPDVYHVINLIPGAGEEYINVAYEMSRSRFPIVRRIEEEIAEAHKNAIKSFHDIMGELFKAFASLSDPVLMASVSPPYDFSLSELCSSEQKYQFYMMPPAEFVDAWSPVIKALFVGAMIYKSRAPQAPQQTWIVDECAQLGAFPMITKLFTYGAGIGIRPWTIFQSVFQMDALGKNAGNIIMSSAALRSYFAVRDTDTANAVSRMIGSETLVYDDMRLQEKSRHAKRQAIQSIMNGGDILSAGLNYAHFRREAEMPSKQYRLLRTPDEVLNTPSDKQYIFTDGVPPIYADRKPYYEQAFMAGRYHPNPYHPPLDRVQVKTRFGHAWRRVVTVPVPPAYAHYPQYRNGIYSYVEKS